jgi:ATP-dependent 26S proteasome regulatory subunit
MWTWWWFFGNNQNNGSRGGGSCSNNYVVWEMIHKSVSQHLHPVALFVWQVIRPPRHPRTLLEATPPSSFPIPTPPLLPLDLEQEVANTVAATTTATNGGGTLSATKKSKSVSETLQEEEIWFMMLEVTIKYALLVVAFRMIQPYLMGLIESMNNDSSTGTGERVSSTTVEKLLHKILQKRDPDNAHKIPCPKLTLHELQIARNVIDSENVQDSFATIGGLDTIKEEMYNLVIWPFQEPRLFAGSALMEPVRGVLLYGPPGTGKTLLAKAVAKEAAAVFLPLPISTICSKFVGESKKMVAASFALAEKLAPSILFVDEMDTFLRANSAENAYLDQIRSEFLTLWDGVGTQSKSKVIVLGATNRPEDIDMAIRRRMPVRFYVPLPDFSGRLAILKILVRDLEMTMEAQTYLPQLAKQTVGYSGSDLKQVCKTAAMERIGERTRRVTRARTSGNTTVMLKEEELQPLRPVTVQDFQIALRKIPRTAASTQLDSPTTTTTTTSSSNRVNTTSAANNKTTPPPRNPSSSSSLPFDLSMLASLLGNNNNTNTNTTTNKPFTLHMDMSEFTFLANAVSKTLTSESSMAPPNNGGSNGGTTTNSSNEQEDDEEEDDDMSIPNISL